MIKFKQKVFSKEYDAMIKLYKLVTKFDYKGPKVQIINKSELLPILKGNNIIIERFVIYSPTIGKDTYRMYLKVGNKANFPDNIKLSDFSNFTNRGKFGLKLNNNGNNNNGNNNNNNKKDKRFSLFKLPDSISYETYETRPLGELISSDIKTRTVVFDFETPESAVKSLNILPFGLNYKLYLLNSYE